MIELQHDVRSCRVSNVQGVYVHYALATAFSRCSTSLDLIHDPIAELDSVVMPDQELVKHVAQFDTIELGNMIVCGLSPHHTPLYMYQTQDDVYCA